MRMWSCKFFEGVRATSNILDLGVNQVMETFLEMLNVQRRQQHLCVSLTFKLEFIH